MYFKAVWGFNGTDEEKKAQKEQLNDVLSELGAKVSMIDIDIKGEKAFIITVEK